MGPEIEGEQVSSQKIAYEYIRHATYLPACLLQVKPSVAAYIVGIFASVMCIATQQYTKLKQKHSQYIYCLRYTNILVQCSHLIILMGVVPFFSKTFVLNTALIIMDVRYCLLIVTSEAKVFWLEYGHHAAKICKKTTRL